jgi:hypothetical protein
MGSMKRVELAVLLLIVAAFLAGTPADAGTWISLTPTDPEGTASGEYGEQRVHWEGLDLYADVTVRCKGLTAGATYDVWMWYSYWDPIWGNTTWYGIAATFVATKQGTGQVSLDHLWLGYGGGNQYYFDVSNADGVVLLTGSR